MLGARALARTEELTHKLRSSGHRMTPQRMAVLRALLEPGDHPTADQVYRRVATAFPMMSQATVYKTIDALKSMGEILELEFRDGANRYDANIPSPHPHLICTRCGKLEDLFISGFDALAAEAAQQTGFVIERLRLDFYGICPACKEVAGRA